MSNNIEELKVTPLYRTYELSIKTDNPYEEVTVIFEDEKGNKTTVKGFAAAKNMIKIRFYPSVAGRYTYNIKDETGNIYETGEFICRHSETIQSKTYDNVKKTYQKDIHGIVRAAGTHFRHDDGTWFKPFGTTVYALTHQTKELTDTTMKTLKNSPFNKIRMCLFPKHYDYNHNEPEYFAFEKNEDGRFDVTRPCFAFWDDFEERIRELDKMGIQCDLILFHPYDRWGFADFTLEEAKIYLDYAIRRLASLPNIWWSLANEFDLMKYTKEEWVEIAEFVAQNDPFGHLLSNHNCIEFWDFDNKDTTHVCLQIKTCDEISGFIRKHGKPVVVDECCYEGNIAYEWGNISAFEMMNKFWMAVAQGGYCTHGETFLSEDEILWWSRGGVFKGESVPRIAFLKEIVDMTDEPFTYCGYEFSREQYEAINADPSLAENDFWRAVCRTPWDRAKGAMLNGKEYAATAGEKIYIKYLERKCAAITDFNLSDKYTYNVELIDAWNMTRETILTGVSGKLKVNLPGKEGMALLAYVTE